MRILTVRSRLYHALIFVLALNGFFAGVCWSDEGKENDFFEELKEIGDKLDNGWLNDGGSDKPSEPDRTGPGYGFSEAQDIEPTYSEAELQKMQEREMRQQAEQKANDKNEHETFVQNERERLRYGMKSNLEACKYDLNNTSTVVFGETPAEMAGYPHSCTSAQNMKHECAKLAMDINARAQRLRAKYPSDRLAPSSLYCHEVFAGLEDPFKFAAAEKEAARNRRLAEKKAGNTQPTQGSNSGSSAPKQANAPTKEQVMEYVQKSAAACLRRFPNPSPQQVEACSQEKANAYRP